MHEWQPLPRDAVWSGVELFIIQLSRKLGSEGAIAARQSNKLSEWESGQTMTSASWPTYDALQDKKDKVTQKHLCKKFLEYSINEIDMLYN